MWEMSSGRTSRRRTDGGAGRCWGLRLRRMGGGGRGRTGERTRGRTGERARRRMSGGRCSRRSGERMRCRGSR